MSRYIDVEELKHITNNSKYYGTQELRDFLDMVYETHTADVVKVVRCKDCKHLKGNNGYDRPWCGLTEWMDNSITKQLDDYCSHGERRVDVR